MNSLPDWKFKVLFDGDCPFCRREVRWLQRRNYNGQLAFEDISSPSFAPERYDATRNELMAALHGVFPDGRLIRGLEVFRQAYRAVNIGWILAPTTWPLLRPVADWLYMRFAHRRVALGRLFGRRCDTACVPPRDPHS